jgi:hypothetical protein
MYRMRVETLRIKSFSENIHFSGCLNESWKPWKNVKTPFTIAVLARLALFYFGHPGTVKCGFCGKKFFPHLYTDEKQLHRHHKLISQSCKFLKEFSDNISLTEEYKFSAGPNTERVFLGAFPIHFRDLEDCTKKTPSVLSALRIYARSGFHNIEMLEKNTRLQSFQKPEWLFPDCSEKLADAGFFLVGPGDYIECYQCGLGLKNWDVSFCPYENHLYYKPHCSHTILVRSEISISNFKNRLAQRFIDILERNTPNESYSLVSSGEASQIMSEGKNEECVICYSAARNVTIFPCRHFSACGSCVSNLANCAVCKTSIQYFMKVYNV